MSLRRALSLLLAGLSTFALGADLYVIASPEVRLSGEEVREAFLGKRQFAGNVLLRPVDNAPSRADFVDRALDMDLMHYETHWTKKSFREGMQPPALKSGDHEVIRFVARNRGAVGYVSEPPPGANILARY